MNCRPGDLAVITYDDISPQNIGKFVTVLELFNYPVHGWENAGPIWTVRPCTTLVSIELNYATGQLLAPPHVHSDDCEHPDAWLRPITPPEGSVTDEEVRELYAPKVPEAA